MADNRMYLVHEASGQRVLIAKDFDGTWSVHDPATSHLDIRLQAAFAMEHAETMGGFASTGWRIEYEHPER